jgi:hypothetical protein
MNISHWTQTKCVPDPIFFSGDLKKIKTFSMSSDLRRNATDQDNLQPIVINRKNVSRILQKHFTHEATLSGSFPKQRKMQENTIKFHLVL